MKNLISILTFALFLITLGCEKTVDLESEKADIVKMLATADQELLDGVIKEGSTEKGTSINIMKGELRRLSGAEVASLNKPLLEKGKFIKIENLDGPIINISPDGNMAWVAVKTKFVIAYTDSTGQENEWEGIEARLAVYEKKDNEWEDVAMAQTF